MRKEGVADDKVFFVGNVMIDSLVYYQPKVDQSSILNDFNLTAGEFVLVTLHRPSNVDLKEQLESLVSLLNSVASKRKVVFPIHPRTRKSLDNFSLMETLSENVILTDPVGYIDFQALVKNAELILTDSGGIQEESTYLGVQCLTLRTSTERPVTVDVGTNYLIGEDFSRAESVSLEILNGKKKSGSKPELWDGKAAERITKILVDKLYQ